MNQDKGIESVSISNISADSTFEAEFYETTETTFSLASLPGGEVIEEGDKYMVDKAFLEEFVEFHQSKDNILPRRNLIKIVKLKRRSNIKQKDLEKRLQDELRRTKDELQKKEEELKKTKDELLDTQDEVKNVQDDLKETQDLLKEETLMREIEVKRLDLKLKIVQIQADIERKQLDHALESTSNEYRKVRYELLKNQ